MAMLQRTTALLFRKTRVSLSEGAQHILKPEEVPPSSKTRGFFGPLNGPFKYFRVIDLMWVMNRFVDFQREHFIVMPITYFFAWMFMWQGSNLYLYSDGKPPRVVDWNTKEAGYLPPGYKSF